MNSTSPGIWRFILLVLLSFAIIGCEDDPASTDDELTSIQVTAGSNTVDFPNLFFTVDTSFFNWFVFWGTTSSDTLFGIYIPSTDIASGKSISLTSEGLLLFAKVGDYAVVNFDTLSLTSGTMDFTTVNATNATGSFSAGASLLTALLSEIDNENATLTKGTIAGPFDIAWDDGSGMPPLTKKINELKKSLR